MFSLLLLSSDVRSFLHWTMEHAWYTSTSLIGGSLGSTEWVIGSPGCSHTSIGAVLTANKQYQTWWKRLSLYCQSPIELLTNNFYEHMIRTICYEMYKFSHKYTHIGRKDDNGIVIKPGILQSLGHFSKRIVHGGNQLWGRNTILTTRYR